MSDESSNFIRTRIDADRAAGRWGGRVATRFPPEPNGYLHLGHVKALCLNFGIAADYDGTCNLRFDDTNPVTEDPEFVEGIQDDIRWLGFEPAQVLYASDYFPKLYDWAVELVRAGKAYVDDQDVDAMRAGRGTVTEPGTDSPWRERSVDENLDLLQRMKDGEFEDGSRVLRAKIDMAHDNMLMRDPLMYRIRHAHHYRAGDAWCIYPMYDWAHGQSDAIEGITHSLCSLEFDVHRPLYDWFTAALELPEPPNQIEFARLSLTYTKLSKRFFKAIVERGTVAGYDDPRMPTLAGIRRRGVRPEALRTFADRVGMARANSTVELEMLEHTIRDDLNRVAPRRMAVLDPLEVELTNATAADLTAPDFPADVGLPGEHTVPFDSRIVIERSDFAVDPPPGFKRLVPGGEVRLRHAHVIRCDEVVTDDAGEVVKLRCSVDEATLGRKPEGRKVKGVIHWVSAERGVPATVRLYDRLFQAESPGAETGDYLDDLNPESLVEKAALVEPAAVGEAGDRVQFERHGYVYRAPEDQEDGLVYTLIIALKDRWEGRAAEPVDEDDMPTERMERIVTAESHAQTKAEGRDAFFASEPEAQASYDALVAAGSSEDEAWTVASDPRWRTLHAEAGGGSDVAGFIANTLVAEARDIDELPFDGAMFGKLVGMVHAGTFNARLARKVLGEMLAHGGDPGDIASAKGWVQESDEDALTTLIDEVLAGHEGEVGRYRAGETKLLGFLMGQVMKRSQGKANPGVVRGLLAARLDQA